jgi:tRNA nucleotidyltransferase (CCA-adding enzyme)
MDKFEVALEVLKKINESGYYAYIVGGFSRDYYLGVVSDDIDICTSANYNELCGIFSDVQNRKHGSYFLNFKDFCFEITTFRHDGRYIKSRHPKSVKFVSDLKSDLKRRDFTVNTLCIDCNGDFVDLMNARIDINHKIIKLIGSKNRIFEDSLRILRAIRFATILNFSIDYKLSKAIDFYKSSLVNLSFDRKKNELDKIFSSNNAKYGIDLIRKYGLDRFLNIDISDVVIVDDLCGMWAQVVIDDSYNFSKSDRYKIFKIKDLINVPFELYDLYLYGLDIFKVVSKIKGDDLDIVGMYNLFPIKDRDDIDVDFFDICDKVSVNDYMIGNIYSDIERKIVYGELKNQKEDILNYIVGKYKCQ